MKIGILTFHRAINYGAVLQCYALQEYLKSLGHDVQIIDYRPDYIEKYRKVFSKLSQDTSFFQILLIKIVEIIKSPLVLFTNHAFDVFLSSMLNVSKRIRKSTDLYGVYDAIFFGSDQIWSPSICNGFDKIYYGQFSHEGTRLISYATSIGGHNVLTEEQWKTVGNYLKDFDVISVREEVFCKQLLRLGLTPKIVVDPSILMPKNRLENLAIKPKQDNYILLFMLEENDDAYNFAHSIASQTNSIVIRLQASKAIRHRKDIVYVEAITPQHFCGYIKYAKCVVNISFHGTAFSILYNKPFYTLHSFQEDRAANLLSILGLEKRLVYAKEKTTYSEIDYTEVNKAIDSLRKESIDFICSSLDNRY